MRVQHFSAFILICIDPANIIQFNGAPNITEGLQYSLTCIAFGRPRPSINWSTNISLDRYSINTTSITSIEGYTVQSMFIINTTIYTDTGIYTCTAINNANGNDSPPIEDTASVFVTILSK